MRNDTVAQLDKTKTLFANIPFIVNTYDIDVAGHVNNIVYIRWLEDLRNNLITEYYSLKELLQNGYYPVVVHSEMKYRKQIKLFDKPVGKMILHNSSHGLMVLKAEILVDDDIVFKATQKCVLMNMKDNKMFKRSINDLFRQFRETGNNN
jgi:acyl-CoA thioester hydrolase